MMVMKMVNYDKYTEAVEAMCDDYCKMPDICETQERLDRHCQECPINTLFCEEVDEGSDNPWKE